ncbi:MAG TPA: hypothetical protein VHQ47_17975 [Phycisphaerae bacterium]|nr:hypothetical protein [Phycisphaerae bacterium]
MLAENPLHTPHPLVDFEILLPDGSLCKAVWAWIPNIQTAKLITVFFHR